MPNRPLPLIPTILLACATESGEGPIDDMLVEYDLFLEDQHVEIEAYRASEGLPPIPFEAYLEDGISGWGFTWAEGTEQRACLIRMGRRDEYRDHRAIGCFSDILTTDDHHLALRPFLAKIGGERAIDLDAARMDWCSGAGEETPGFPWRDCLSLARD